MDVHDESSIHAHYSVFNNTINNFSPPSEPQTSTSDKWKTGWNSKDEEFRRQLASKATQHASFNASERGDPPKCHPDTRAAVQDSLVAWRGNPNAGSVRLISGWAGTGKTTIAQTMAEYWAKQGQLAASYFFSRSAGNLGGMTGSKFEETLLHQLLQNPNIPIIDFQFSTPKRTNWSEIVEGLSSALPLPLPMVIVIDGLDECTSQVGQVRILRAILSSVDQLGPSIKFLISCRPERHLENIFDEFAVKLDPAYRIHLGQSPEDKDDLRTFLRVSFDRICQDRRKDGAMSITDQLWPSHDEIEELVDRASGQFIFVSTVIAFVDDESQDPVRMLNLVLKRRTSSFKAVDTLYLVILERAEEKIGDKGRLPELCQLTRNLILHVNGNPSSSFKIAQFWFEEEVTINILVKHLRAVLVRQDSEDLKGPIQFRHKSFHDFFVHPSEPHPFSLAEINPVSKFFFSLRMSAKDTSRSKGVPSLQASQLLGYTFLYCGDHLFLVLSLEEEARRLHQIYAQTRPMFRGCVCFLQLGDLTNMNDVQTIKSCAQDDCVIDEDLRSLCRMIAIDSFAREWTQQQKMRPISFNVLIFFLWFKAFLFSLSDPLSALQGIVYDMIFRHWRLSLLGYCVAVLNAFLCILVLVNTRYEFTLLLYVSHLAVCSLLRRFLSFGRPRIAH
ncbi:hypothetical protein BDN72DRAFT_958213 [Pluteus cervinus]|uniref:Uncharacterized protein n=1 Tax=Pluteus cervinus TaxID=181527 RepID=A0ACD3B106_9AGAR|nr:hypothetical protein BDN72DRAFT_958213 [Pluteus cervinus]